jgi:hypothetical protein
MLVVQYGVGIFLNLYVAVPAAEARAGIFHQIATAPFALTVHALLGLALIGTAIVLLARAVGLRDPMVAVLATTGLTAIGGAFGAGEIFVRNEQSGASMAMAVLTGVALLCYVGTLMLATTAQRQTGRPRPVHVPPTAAPPRSRDAFPRLARRADAQLPPQDGWHVAPPPKSTSSRLVRE